MSDLVTNLRNGYLTTCISSWDAQQQKEQLMLQAAAEIEKNDVQRTNLLNALAAKEEKIERLTAELKRVQELHTGLMKNADDKYDALNAELAAAKVMTNQGWDKYYELRKWLADQKYPNMDEEVRAALTDTPAVPQSLEPHPDSPEIRQQSIDTDTLPKV